MMEALPLRLHPGDDLRGAVEQALRDAGAMAGYLVQGIGSLSVAYNWVSNPNGHHRPFKQSDCD